MHMCKTQTTAFNSMLFLSSSSRPTSSSFSTIDVSTMTTNNDTAKCHHNEPSSPVGGTSVPYNKLLFPFKLRQLLDDAEEENLTHIVSWLGHGQAFKVHKPKEFAEGIMRKHFRQTQFKSFTRQLYHYGFGKVDSGGDRGAFYHPQFRKDDPNGCFNIERKNNHKKSVAARFHQEQIYRRLSGGVQQSPTVLSTASMPNMNGFLSSTIDALEHRNVLDLTSLQTKSRTKPLSLMDVNMTLAGANKNDLLFQDTAAGVQQNDATDDVEGEGHIDWLSTVEHYFDSAINKAIPADEDLEFQLEPTPIEDMVVQHHASDFVTKNESS